jgi:hypothetical protein
MGGRGSSIFSPATSIFAAWSWPLPSITCRSYACALYAIFWYQKFHFCFPVILWQIIGTTWHKHRFLIELCCCPFSPGCPVLHEILYACVKPKVEQVLRSLSLVFWRCAVWIPAGTRSLCEIILISSLLVNVKDGGSSSSVTTISFHSTCSFLVR